MQAKQRGSAFCCRQQRASIACCRCRGDLPLPEPVRSAILASKSPGIRRMPVETPSAAMKATQRRHDLGQSIWLDNSTRDMLTSGTLKHRAVSDRADSEPDDPRPRNQEQRFLRCRDPREAQGRQGPAANRRRIPEEISVGANPLSASQQTCCTKEIPNDAICRPPAHN